jgi:hypothetical protein
MWLMTRDKLINLSNIRGISIERYDYLPKDEWVEIDGGEEAGGFEIGLGGKLGGYFIKGLAKVIKDNPAENAIYPVEEVIKIGKEKQGQGL